MPEAEGQTQNPATLHFTDSFKHPISFELPINDRRDMSLTYDASRLKASEASEANLSRMPVEILNNVAGNLLTEGPRLGDFWPRHKPETLPDGSEHGWSSESESDYSRATTRLSSEFRSQFLALRRALRNLCRVSRRLRTTMQPYLYRVIVVSRIKQLLCLLRTLIEVEHLQPLIHRLIIFLNIEGSSGEGLTLWKRYVSDCMMGLPPNLSPLTMRAVQFASLTKENFEGQVDGSTHRRLLQSSLGAILCMTPKLAALFIRGGNIFTFAQIYKDLNTVIRQALQDEVHPCPRQIETLQFQSDEQPQYHMETPFYPILHRFNNLRTVELRRSNYRASPPLVPPGGKNRLERVCLCKCWESHKLLKDLCARANAVRDMDVSFGLDPPLRIGDLSDTLDRFKHSLRSLSLQWTRYNFHGPDYRLDLSQFTVLESLCIDMHAIFGSQQRLCATGTGVELPGPPLCIWKVLPPSLQTLHLIERWMDTQYPEEATILDKTLYNMYLVHGILDHFTATGEHRGCTEMTNLLQVKFSWKAVYRDGADNSHLLERFSQQVSGSRAAFEAVPLRETDDFHPSFSSPHAS